MYTNITTLTLKVTCIIIIINVLRTITEQYYNKKLLIIDLLTY